MFDLNTYLIPEIVVICLILGFVVKKWVADVDNKWIPTVVCIFGFILGLAMKWGEIDCFAAGLAAAVGGSLSGLASTGLHQMFKQWIDNGTK